MLKYCNGCKRDLEIDNFYFYKKSICKECVNKKVKCDYCDKEFNSTNLSKHIKQRHSTNNSTSNNSTSNKTYKNNSTSNNSTSNKTYKNNSTSNKIDTNKSTSNSRTEDENDSTFNIDSMKIKNFLDSQRKNPNFNEKDRDEINSLLAKCRMFADKLYEEIITQKEKRQYITIINKLKKLNYYNKEISDYIIDGIHKYG